MCYTIVNLRPVQKILTQNESYLYLSLGDQAEFYAVNGYMNIKFTFYFIQ